MKINIRAILIHTKCYQLPQNGRQPIITLNLNYYRIDKYGRVITDIDGNKLYYNALGLQIGFLNVKTDVKTKFLLRFRQQSSRTANVKEQQAVTKSSIYNSFWQ